VTPASHRLIWLVPSNQVSSFHHDQPRTLADNGGHHARGQAVTALAAWPGTWLRDEEATVPAMRPIGQPDTGSTVR